MEGRKQEAEELRAAFFDALDRGAEPLEIWQIIVGHPWFRRELHGHASAQLKGRRQRQSLEDLEHDAILALQERIQRRPDLWVDRKLAMEKFPGWMATIARRLFADARRKESSEQCAVLKTDPAHGIRPAFHAERFARQELPPDRRIDVRQALRRLPRQEHRAICLSLRSCTVDEIAQRLGVSQRHVNRLLQAAREKLKELKDLDD